MNRYLYWCASILPDEEGEVTHWPWYRTSAVLIATLPLVLYLKVRGDFEAHQQ